MELEQIRIDKANLEYNMLKLLTDFESKYGIDTINNFVINRWNGSNSAFGRISTLILTLDYNSIHLKDLSEKIKK